MLPRNVDTCDLVAEAGISELYPGYELGRTKPRFHLLVYTDRGKGSFFTPSYQAPVQPGYVLIVPANQPFGYVPLDAPWRFTWVHLPDLDRWSYLAGQGPVIRRTSYSTAINSAMRGFLRECRNPRADFRIAASLYARLIVVDIERELGVNEQQLVADHRVELNDLWEIVANDLRHPWSVREMADRLNLSAPSLYRLCKKYTGMSPMKMVQRLRMERAQELLVLHDYSIAVISDMVGYTNEFAFAVAFKRFSGNPPARFRKRR